MTARVLAEGDIRNQDIVADWMGARERLVEPIVRMYKDMQTTGEVDFATVTVAVRSLDNLLRDGAVGALEGE
jgi:NAD-specific glutamate dehydrogenase